MSANEIKIGDRLDLQRGTMIYKGDGKADAYVVDEDGVLVLKQSDVVLSQQMIEGWFAVKSAQASKMSTHTGV